MQEATRPRKVVRRSLDRRQSPARGPIRSPAPAPQKRPVDIPEIMVRLRRAMKPYTPAAMFQLHDEGYTSVFEILVACIISIRTYEEVTLPTSRKLFAAARTPRQIANLSERQIDELIHACTFHEPKAKQIRQIAVETIERFGGELPC